MKTKRPNLLNRHENLSLFKQLVFFAPLAATSILIVITHSLFNAGLAKLPTPEVYIAAFAVAKSLMHLIASPEMMIRQTVTALVNDQKSYEQVRKFTCLVVGLVVLIMSIVALSDLSRLIFHHLMGLEGQTLDASVDILKILIVFPIGATLRNFMQGMLIKFEKTIYVTIATIVRIVFVFLMVLAVPLLLEVIQPATIAGLMFFGALTIEGIASYLGGRKAIGKIHKRMKNMVFSADKTIITGKYIFRFYLPLAVTGLIHTIAMPIVNAGLGQTHTPEITISAFSVAWHLGMIFLGPAMLFHQVPLNYVDPETGENIGDVRRFAIATASVMTAVLILIAFTPLGYIMMTQWIGVTHEIAYLAEDVLKIMIFMPGLIVLREFYWGILMKKRLTKFVGKGKFLYSISLTLTVVVMMFLPLKNPAIIGGMAILMGDFAEFVYLYIIAKRNQVLEKI